VSHCGLVRGPRHRGRVTAHTDRCRLFPANADPGVATDRYIATTVRISQRTYHRLKAGDTTAFEPSEAFADRPDADLRTDVIPAFYHHAAGFHCARR
jgi:hypothetical protein